MYRSSLVLAATIAAVSFFAGSAVGQFPIKIELPKITKKETPPKSTSNPDTSSDRTPVGSSSATRDVEARGRPISGARITFSNNPDGSNPKTDFTSSEYIYGHLDLGGRTIYDAFGLKNMGPNAKYFYISYHIKVIPGGQTGWEHDWHNGRKFVLITKEDAQKTSWDFDVLPDPTKVSTRGAALEDEGVGNFKFVSGIYGQIYAEEAARSMFPKSGPYTVDVTLYGNSYDDWGKPTGKFEEFPTASARFALQFSGSDGQTIVANAKSARDNMESAKNRREMLHAMPDFWSRPANIAAEPKLAPARLVPIIKSYIGQWNLTYMKHMVYPFNGPIWAVEKNDLGIPRYRRMTSAIYIIYRDPKDNSCQMGTLDMREPYAGGGTYSEAVLNGIGDIQYIDCSAVK